MIRAVIIEDNAKDYELFKQGIEQSKFDFNIVDINLSSLINSVKENEFHDEIPEDIGLFIIDVSLEKGQDELGLEIFKYLQKNYDNKFKYIIASIWDRSEFSTDIKINELAFINKNDFEGFELWMETRSKINQLWQV